MTSKRKNNPYRINPTFSENEFLQIKNIAKKNEESLSEVVRNLTAIGLNITVSQENIEWISSVMKEQIKEVLKPSVERLVAMEAKTCIAAASSMYLNAEALNRLVEPDLRMEVSEAYEKSRKKAYLYLKDKLEKQKSEIN